MTDFPEIQDAWVWPSTVERWFRERTEGRTLHICCGRSPLGDVTIDADPDNSPDIIGDAQRLPIEPCSFDTAIIDPPWKVNVYQRPDWVWPAVEAVVPDGIILTNTTWIPWSHQVRIDEVAVRQDYRQGTISLLSKAVRYPGQTTFEA